MALQNIGVGNRDDAFYRYKMPRLVTRIEGRGNGIKTNLVNMVEVAKALARTPAYTTKYFGLELGAQSKFDEKTGTAIVNGAHETAKLAGLLENFIKKYVQCYGCGNPETEILITKSQLVKLQCAACGFVSDVDMRDKLTTFILKNPPDERKQSDKKGMRRAEKERIKAGQALDEELKKGKKDIRKKKSDENGHDNGHGSGYALKKKPTNVSDEEEHSPTSSQSGDSEGVAEDDDVKWLTDTSCTAAQQRIKEQLTAVTSEMVMLISASEDHGVAKKASDVSVKGGRDIFRKPHERVFAKDSFLDKEELVKDFRKCLEGGFDAMQLVAHLHSVQSTSSEQEAMNAYFEALFGGLRKGVAKDIGKKKPFLSKAMDDEHSQELLLGAVEAYFSSGPFEVCKEVALVLKMLYDLDIVQEDAVLAWYGNNSGDSQVRKHAKPFVEWLQNAESEDDSCSE